MTYSRGLIAANALRMLGGCTKGTPPRMLRLVARACVFPTMAFAAEAWWKYGGKGLKGQAKRLDAAWCKALRAAIPAYRTTSNALVHHFAGLPTAAHLLDQTIRMHAIRIQRLDAAHPLRRRCRTAKDFPGTRLHRITTILPDHPESADPLRHPPWLEPPRATDVAEALASATEGQQRAVRAAEFARWRDSLPPGERILYTDGSKLPDGSTGSGWVLFTGGDAAAR